MAEFSAVQRRLHKSHVTATVCEIASSCQHKMRRANTRRATKMKKTLLTGIAALSVLYAAANAQNQSETTTPAWLERYHRLHEECVQWGSWGAIAGCLLEKDKEYGKELDQAYRKALTLAGTNKPLLRESQRSWHKYQESTCKLYEALMTFEGQGVARLSAAGCLLPLTLQRLGELRWMADCFNRRCAD
jgi:uncharacterized protein YecT (DUF1311 family)